MIARLALFGLRFETLKAKLLLGAAILSSAVALRVWDINHQRNIGAAGVIEDSKEQGRKANEKSAEDRRKSDTPDAAERLRKSACRDC